MTKKVELTEDIKDLIFILAGPENLDVHLSGFLLDYLEPVVFKEWMDQNYKIYLAKQLKKFLDGIINCLGWIEHTHDYDPFLIVEMKDGSTIETASGYYLFEIGEILGEPAIVIEGPENDKEELAAHRYYHEDGEYIIPLDEIKSIRVAR